MEQETLVSLHFSVLSAAYRSLRNVNPEVKLSVISAAKHHREVFLLVLVRDLELWLVSSVRSRESAAYGIRGIPFHSAQSRYLE